jgi:hypothetical protein
MPRVAAQRQRRICPCHETAIPTRITSVGREPLGARFVHAASSKSKHGSLASGDDGRQPGNGVLYEAHRSFDLLHFSNKLQVSAFDLATHKELRNNVVDVPRVHGARAAEGFYLSPDGQTLVYAELHEANLLLVLSAKDLSEVRRTDALPFTSADRYRLFAGFDENGLLSFSSAPSGKLRFVRMNLSEFKSKRQTIRILGRSRVLC